jgi:PRC-barrel domain
MILQEHNMMPNTRSGYVAMTTALSFIGIAAHAQAETADGPTTPKITERNVSTMAVAAAPIVSINDLKIGAPVYGADGAKVGAVNRIKANADGTVREIQVTTGGPPGLNAEVVAVPADRIVSGLPSVKLSLTASEVKSLPVLTSDKS